MEKRTLISIIIPVYNAELYLDACLDSVLQQTYQNLEIVLVNDGSTDSSGKICRRYAEKDNRIVFLSQENAGAAAARNRGLEASSGTYIMFVDADDLLAPGSCEAIQKNVQGQDLVLFPGEIFCASLPSSRTPASDISQPTYFESVDRSIWIRSLLGAKTGIAGYNLSSPWAKAYRKGFLDHHGIRFPEGVSIGEDLLMNLQVFLHTPRVSSVPAATYFYRQTEASAVHRYNPRFLDSDQKFYEELKKILDREDLWEVFQEDIGYQQMNGLLLAFSNDVFHRNNPKSGKKKKADFLKLVSREDYQSQFPIQIHRFEAWKKCILYFAIKKRYYVVKILFVIKALANDIRGFLAGRG